MQLHHLELKPARSLVTQGTRAPGVLASPRAGAAARAATGLLLWVCSCTVRVAGAEAMFASAPATRSLTATAGAFSLKVTPTPSAIRRGPNVHLSWSAVTVSSGDAVQYRVMRTSSGLAPTQTCTGADAPVTSGNLVTCIDRKPGPTSTYTVQAFVVTSSGVETWSLPPSPAVSA